MQGNKWIERKRQRFLIVRIGSIYRKQILTFFILNILRTDSMDSLKYFIDFLQIKMRQCQCITTLLWMHVLVVEHTIACEITPKPRNRRESRTRCHKPLWRRKRIADRNWQRITQMSGNRGYLQWIQTTWKRRKSDCFEHGGIFWKISRIRAHRTVLRVSDENI